VQIDFHLMADDHDDAGGECDRTDRRREMRRPVLTVRAVAR